MIKAVVFDLWETLGTKNVGVGTPLREKFGIPNTDDYLRKYEEAVQMNAWETESQMAEGFLSVFKIQVNQENVSFVVDTFRRGMDKATLFDGMRDLLESLKSQGLRLGLLSNTTIFESAVVGSKLGVRELFDVMVFSWQVGDLKPSPEVFKHVLGQLGLPAEQVVFVDDGERNVAAARALGMEGVVFGDIKSLRASLLDLGITKLK